MTKHLLIIIMNLLTIGAIAGAVVGCSNDEKVHTYSERIELKEKYLVEHGWKSADPMVLDAKYFYADWDETVSDEYFVLRIYTLEGGHEPVLTTCIYYE